MPNISQKRLDDLERIERQHGSMTEAVAAAQSRAGAFDRVLEAIAATARGHSMPGERGMNAGVPLGGYGFEGFEPFAAPRCVHEQPSAEEVRQQRSRELLERIVSLESRLAATAQVADFARLHLP